MFVNRHDGKKDITYGQADGQDRAMEFQTEAKAQIYPLDGHGQHGAVVSRCASGVYKSMVGCALHGILLLGRIL